MQVATLASFDLVLLVNADSKFTSLADMLAFARSNPGKLNFGTINPGSTQFLSAELFKYSPPDRRSPEPRNRGRRQLA